MVEDSDINSDEDYVLHLEESDNSDTDVSVYEIIDIEKSPKPKPDVVPDLPDLIPNDDKRSCHTCHNDK